MATPTKRNRRAGVIDRWFDKDRNPTARNGKGLRYQARYVDSKGKEVGRSFRTKRDAQAWLNEQTADLVKGTYIDPTKGAATVASVAETWRAGLVSRKQTTSATYETLLETYILPKWGETPLNEIDHSEVVQWVADLSAGKAPIQRKPQKNGRVRGAVPLSASTVRQTHKVFAQILTTAVRNKQLNANPADHVPLPRLRQGEARFLTSNEVAQLAFAADFLASVPKRPGARTDLAPTTPTLATLPRDDDGNVQIPASEPSEGGLIIRLLAGTGLRFGELAGLIVRRVDLEQRKLSVVEGVVEVGGEIVVDDTKSHQVRTVPFRDSLSAPLRAQVSGKAPDAFVFSNRDGGALRLRNWSRRVFAPACELAGINGVTVHDLRHTAASLAISQGMHVKAVQRLLGHASAAMTLDVYAALFPDDLTAIGND